MTLGVNWSMTKIQRRWAGAAWAWFLGLGAALITIEYVLTGFHLRGDYTPAYPFIVAGVFAAAATVAGILINRPARPAGWIVVAGATIAFAGGQVSVLLGYAVQAPWLEHLAVASYLAQY